ncbi:MAG: arsenate reductase ArsC [Dehalococcoidia bacterium]|nr:arsenate reductase ArsC [Dehalococcoidia bacterium]
MTSILFLCTHNAGRSQMAAGWARHLGGAHVTIFSGGSEPASEVNPAAIEAMAEAGIDIAGAQPQQWSEAMLAEADIVVTMGCGDACPFIPGRRYLDWELPDPAGRPLAEVRLVRDEVARLVRGLLAELGVPMRVPSG